MTGPPEEARKFDGDKVRYDLVPAVPLHEVAQVFTFGANKYSDYNYLGLDRRRIFAALLRHSFSWWRGEDLDEESGLPHLAHAACCVLMLRHQETQAVQTRQHSATDTRPDLEEIERT